MKKNGFTLIELLVTIALLSIIGIVIVVNVVGVEKKQEIKTIEREKSILTAAVDAYIHVEDIKVNEEIIVKVSTLVEENYLKESLLGKYKNSSIKVTRTTDKALIYEIIEGENDEE